MTIDNLSDVGPWKKSLILIAVYLILVIPVNKFFQYLYVPPWPEWLSLSFYLSLYLIIGLLIYEERENLANSNIDKSFLILFLIFGSILRIMNSGNPIILCVGNLLFVLIAFWLFIVMRKSKPQFSHPRLMGVWLLIAILVGIWEVALFAGLGFFEDTLSGLLSKTTYNVVGYFFYSLGNPALSEEPVFRGFLWGIMRRFGYKEKTILCFQAILFTLAHFDFNSKQPVVVFFVGTLIFSVLVGFIAWKSRSVTPGLVAHALHNTMVYLVRL